MGNCSTAKHCEELRYSNSNEHEPYGVRKIQDCSRLLAPKLHKKTIFDTKPYFVVQNISLGNIIFHLGFELRLLLFNVHKFHEFLFLTGKMIKEFS